MASHAESLSKADYEALAEFRYALRKFLGFSETAAGKYGVTPQQYQALLAIEGFPGRNWVTIGELAEQMRIAHHSAVGLVDRIAEGELTTLRAAGVSDPAVLEIVAVVVLNIFTNYVNLVAGTDIDFPVVRAKL